MTVALRMEMQLRQVFVRCQHPGCNGGYRNSFEAVAHVVAHNGFPKTWHCTYNERIAVLLDEWTEEFLK